MLVLAMHNIVLLLCISFINSVLAVRVSTFSELQRAIEVTQDNEIIIDAVSINLDRPLQFSSGTSAIIRGETRSDGSLPKIFGAVAQSTSHFIVSGAATQVIISNLTLAPSQEIASPEAVDIRGSELFTIHDGAQILSNNVHLAGGLCRGWILTSDNFCVSGLAPTTATRNDAEADCASRNYHLPSVHSERALDGLSGLVESTSDNRMWLGGKLDAEGKPLEWSDGSDAQDFPWPLSNSQATNGACVYLDGESAGLWTSTSCDAAELEHPYACAVSLGTPASALGNLLGTDQGVQHTRLTLDVADFEQFAQVFNTASSSSTSVTVEYVDNDGVLRSATVNQPTNPLAVQVKLSGTSLSSTLTALVDSSVSTTPTQGVFQGEDIVFDIAVTGIPHLLQVITDPGDATQTTIASVQLLVGGAVVFETTMDADCFNDASVLEGTFTPYVVANSEVGVPQGHHFSQDFTESGCNTMSLWTHPSRPSPLELRVQGTNLPNLVVSASTTGTGTQLAAQTGWISLPVPNDGIVALPMESLTSSILIPAVFKVDAIGSGCLGALSLRYYGVEVERLDAFAADITIEECPDLCGHLYDSVNQCMKMESSNLQQIATATLDLLATEGTCAVVENAESFAGKSNLEMCTFQGNFTLGNYDAVFDDSSDAGFSTFALTFLPASIPTPPRSLPKNRILVIDGLNLNVEEAQGETAVTIPNFQIEGSVDLNSVLVADGLTVSGNGKAAFANSELVGRIIVQDTANLIVQGGVIKLETQPSFLLQGQSSIEITGVLVPQELNQASTLLETTSTVSVIASSLSIENPHLDIGPPLSEIKLPVGQVQYEYTVCSSDDPNSVSMNTLTLMPGITDEAECQKACDEATCSGFGLDVDETTNDLTCRLCLEVECTIGCEDAAGVKTTGIYMAATSQPGFVKFDGCFAATSQPVPIKVVPSLSEFATVREAKCNAVCDLYQDCGATRIEGTECKLYPRTALASEGCSPSLPYSIRFPLEVAEFALIPLEQTKDASPAAKIVVGTRTLEECTVLCSHHQACDMFQHDDQEGLCTLLTEDSEKSAPWISSGLPNGNDEVYVSIGPEFPRVVFEEWRAESSLVVNPEDALATARLDEADCATECSTIANCVAFQFAELDSISSSTENCILHSLEGMRSVLRTDRAGPSPFKVMVASVSKDFVPIGGNSDVSLGDGLELSDVSLKYENVFSFDACKALCFIQERCDVIEYNIVSYDCFVVPFKENNDAFAVLRDNFNITNPNASLLKLHAESPFDNDVVYTRVEGKCLDTVPVGSVDQGATLDGCKAFCNVHPDCQVFIFSEAQGCVLYKSISVPEDESACNTGPEGFYVASHDPDAESYFRVPFDSCFVKQLGDDGVIAVPQVDGVQQCGEACKAESTCRAYSFDDVAGCVLRDDSSLEFDGCINPVDSFLESFSQYFTRSNTTSIGSVALFTVEDAQTTLVQCESLCIVFEKCVAIAVSLGIFEEKAIGGKCVLLTTSNDGEVGSDTFEQDGEILVVLDSYNPYLFTPVSNLRVAPSPSKVLTEVPVFTAATQKICEALCESVAACNSITYHVETLECTLFEANSWTQDEYVGEIRSPKLHYSVGFERFVNQIPDFARFTGRGEYFASTEAFEVLSEVPTAAACQRACLESEQQCGLAHFHQLTNSCSLFPENTKVSNAGATSHKFCEELHLAGTQALDLAEIILLDAQGAAMYDSEVTMRVNEGETGQEVVDGLASTIFAAPQFTNKWVATLCAPKLIHKVKVRYDYGGGRTLTRYALYIPENRPEYNQPLYNTPGFESMKFREVSTLKHRFELGDNVVDLPLDRIEQPSQYILREHDCVGSNGHISTLRPRLPVECAQHCNLMPRCVAFNYDKSTGTCYFTNDISAVPLENCEHLDAYIDMNSIPFSVPPQRCCSVVRVEMDSTAGRELGICEIEFLDAAGNAMVDSQAGLRARSSEGSGSSTLCTPGNVECAFDGNAGSDLSLDGCFVGTTEPVAFLETTVCTPRPVERVRITSRGQEVPPSRAVRNAKVFMTSSLIASSESPRAIGVIEYFDAVNSVATFDTHGFCGLPAPGLGAPAAIANTVHALPLPTYGCQRVIIESALDSHLQICEVEVYSEEGQLIFDSKAASRATASSVRNAGQFSNPRFAVDGNDATDATRYGCFESDPSQPGPAFWETMFCSTYPIGSIRVVGATDEDGPVDVLNGATVTIMQSTGQRDVVGTLSNFDVMGHASQVIEVIPGSVNPTTSSFRADLYCGTVMVDLEASEAGSRLEICNVEVLDRAGNIMFDSNARRTAKAHSMATNSGFEAHRAVDSNTNTDGSQGKNCYRSSLLQGEARRVGGVDQRPYGWWKAEFCTPRPIEAVRIQRRTDSEADLSLSFGASVFFGNFKSEMRYIGRLLSDAATVLDTSTYCNEAFVTQDDGQLQVREVEFLPSSGVSLATQQLASATTLPSNVNSFPENAVDGDSTSLYSTPSDAPPGLTATWKSSFCSSKLPRALRVSTGSMTSAARVLSKINTDAPKRLGMIGSSQVGPFQMARHCTRVTVELDGGTNRMLQLLEVRVRNAHGFEVLDFNAASRSAANLPPHPTIIPSPPPAIGGGVVNHPITGRFFSAIIPGGQTGSWNSVFCLAGKVSDVEVQLPNVPILAGMNGARVYITDGTDQVRRLIGEIQGDLSTNSRVHKFPVVSDLCPTIRIEKAPSSGTAKPLKLCFLARGSEPHLLHYNPAELASSSSGNNPENGVLSDAPCYESNPVSPGQTAYWQSSFCETDDQFDLFINDDRSVPVSPSFGAKVKILRNNKFVDIATYDFKSDDRTWRTSLPLELDLPTGCTSVRVELEGGNNKFLQISEVRVLDAEGNVMTDPGAAERATGTETPGDGQQAHQLPTKAVDGVFQANQQTAYNGYHSKSIPTGEVGFWETTFCVPRTVAMVEVHGRQHPNQSTAERMNGARVYVNHDANPFRPNGPFRGTPVERAVLNFVQEKDGHIWRIPVSFGSRISSSRTVSLPPESCMDVRVRIPAETTLNLCEIELRDSQGRVMLDPTAGARAPIYEQDKSNFVITDGDPGVGTSQCAVMVSPDDFFSMSHKVRFCTPRPVASITLFMDSPKETADQIELHVTARHGAVGRENEAVRVGGFDEVTKSQRFELQSCDTVRVELPGDRVIPSVEDMELCTTKAKDESGNSLSGNFALSSANRANGPFTGSCDRMVGWWEGTFCGERPARVVNVFGENNSRDPDIDEARVFLYPNQVHKPLELGKAGITRNRQYAGFHHVPDISEITSYRESRFGSCSTVSVDLDEGDVPLGLCKVRVFDEAGTEMVDRASVLSAKSIPQAKHTRSAVLPVYHHLSLQPTGVSGCFETLPSEGHRHWEATMCLPRPIASISVVAFRERIPVGTQQHLGTVKVTTRSMAAPEAQGFESTSVQHFGALEAQPGDGRHPEFRLLPKLAPEPDYPTYDNNEVLGSIPASSGPSCVDVEVVTLVDNEKPLPVCELSLLDPRGEAIPMPPAEQIQIKASGGFANTGSKISRAIDGLSNTCYVSFVRSGRLAVEARICGVNRPIGGVRLEAGTGKLSLPKGTRVYLTTNDGTRMLVGAVSPENTQKLDLMIDSVAEDHFGEFLLPYDNADFGEVAEDAIGVGKKMDNALRFSFQTKESCAALCSEWFQCAGFFLQSRTCSLRPGLAVDDFLDGSTFPNVVAPSPPSVPRPTSSPSASPTVSPTAALSRIQNFERTLGPFAALDPGQGLCLPSLRTTETAFVEAIQLEACSTLCKIMPECRAMKWNLEGCQLYTGRRGFDIEPCAVDDIGSVHLISLQRLLEDENVFRMENIGNRYTAFPGTGVETGANELSADECANACLESSSCLLSEFFIANDVPVCKLHDSIPGSSTGADAFKVGELTDDPRTLSQSSLKVRRSKYQVLKGKKVVNAPLVNTFRSIPFLGCMALCEVSQKCDGFNFDNNSHECSLVTEIPVKQEDVKLQSIVGADFYRSNFVHRRSQFGGPEDFVRLANNVDRSECEGACQLLGPGCKAIVHTITGECRLTRFAQTQPGVLRNNLGYCLVKEDDGIIRPSRSSPDCLEVSFQYVFTNDVAQSSLGRIRLASEPNTCIARRLEIDGSTVVRREGLVELNCDNEEQGGLDLSWTTEATVVNALFSNVGDAETVIHLCSEGVDVNIRCPEETWGIATKEHSSGRFVDVYVDAETLEQSQVVSNPNFLFFQWLYSSEGKTARSLHAKMRQFASVVKTIQSSISRGVLVASGALAIFSNIQAPIDMVGNTISPILSLAKIFSLIAKLGEKIPYVKFVAKPIRLVLDFARNTISNNFNKVVKAIRKTDKLLDPLDSFEDRLTQASTVFASASTAVQIASSSMLSLAFCASTSALQARIALMDRKMKEAMKAADDFMSLGSEIPKVTKVIGTVRNIFNKFVFKPAESAVRAFRPVLKVVKAFGWLETVFTTRVCFKLPIVGRVCLPSLEDIGNFVSSIIRKIRKIPFVGRLIGLVEKIVLKVLKAIFNLIGIPLPSIPINFSFADQLFDDLTLGLNVLVTRIDEMVDLDAILPLDFNIVDTFDVSLLPDIDFLGIVPDPVLGLQIPGVDLPNFEEVGDVVAALFEEAAELARLLGTVLAEKPVCTKPAPAMRCEDIFRQLGPVGDALQAELGASGCPLPLIPSCGEWEIPGLAVVQEDLEALGERIERQVFGVQSGRRLGDGDESFSFEITLLGEDGLFNFLFPELQEKFGNIVNDRAFFSPQFFNTNIGAFAASLDASPGFLSLIIGRDKGRFRATFEVILQQLTMSVAFRRTSTRASRLNPRDIVRIRELTKYVTNLEEWNAKLKVLGNSVVPIQDPETNTLTNVLAELNLHASIMSEEIEKFLQSTAGTTSLAGLETLGLPARTKAARKLALNRKKIEDNFENHIQRGKTLGVAALRRIASEQVPPGENDRKLRTYEITVDDVFDNKWFTGGGDFAIEREESPAISALKNKLKEVTRDSRISSTFSNIQKFADFANADIFRAILDFKFNPKAFGNLIGGVTNVEISSTSFDAQTLQLGEGKNFFSFLDPWSLRAASSDSVLYGPIVPFANLVGLLDQGEVLLDSVADTLVSGEKVFEFGAGVAINLPFGFTITVAGPNSCSLLGFSCFDGPVCPVFGFVPGVEETGKSDGAVCTCGEQCDSGECSGTGVSDKGTCLNLDVNITTNATIPSEPDEGGDLTAIVAIGTIGSIGIAGALLFNLKSFESRLERFKRGGSGVTHGNTEAHGMTELQDLQGESDIRIVSSI